MRCLKRCMRNDKTVQIRLEEKFDDAARRLRDPSHRSDCDHGSRLDKRLGAWNNVGLSMLAYGSVSVLLLVVTGKNFGYNIKAYHRRLLPVHSVWNVVSSLLLASVLAGTWDIDGSAFMVLLERSGHLGIYQFG